ncbi:MAG: T9SS type A sorting domain-containing protein, partial [candidate division Zixibacteria bacterium]|nr:T9SS type A sorting domain-containing protein [candidate division Zixibacteria bacterium]
QDSIAINVYPTGSMEQRVTAGPNPFADSVTIFISPSAGSLELLSIYNVAGEIVWEIVNISPVSADTPIRWDGTNMRHEAVASGVYFVRVRTSTNVYRLKLFKSD